MDTLRFVEGPEISGRGGKGGKMQCKTPVTITWKDPYQDWHWFWLRQLRGSKLLLTGASAPNGTPHDGDSFWCEQSEIMVIKKNHIRPLFLPDFSSWQGLT